MNNYDIRQEIFSFILNNLSSNPLSDGYVTINSIYSNLEAKPKNVRNFLSMKKEDLPTKFSLNCKEIKVLFTVDIYMENEILADKFANLFVERYENSKTENLRIRECEPIGGEIPLDQNMFLKQIQFKVIQ